MAVNLAIIDAATRVVANTVVPPEGPQVFFIGNGFEGVLYDTDIDPVAIGWKHEGGVFVNPNTPPG